MAQRTLRSGGVGVTEASTPGDSATVTSTSSVIVAAMAGRRELNIVNDSDATIFLSLGGTAVAHKGPRINAEGGCWWTPASIAVYEGAVSAITEQSGDKVVTITEY